MKKKKKTPKSAEFVSDAGPPASPVQKVEQQVPQAQNKRPKYCGNENPQSCPDGCGNRTFTGLPDMEKINILWTCQLYQAIINTKLSN